MKVILLDIDGVLNSERSFMGGCHRIDRPATTPENAEEPYTQRLARETVDPIAVGLINKLTKHAEAQIVLISTHRKNFRDHDKYLMAQLQKYLTSLGLLGDKCIDCTPVLFVKRGEEIKLWLDQHPEVTHYVILDDDSDMLPEQLENFILVDSRFGLSADDFRRACAILGVPASIIAQL